MEITFNEGFAGALQFALKQPVIGLPLELQIGDLKRFGQPAHTFWATKASYDATQSAPELYAEIQRGLDALTAAIEAGEALRVWWSETADDQLGFEWLCARLGTRKLPLTQVKVPLKQVLTTPGLHLRTYAQLDELDADTIAGLSALTQPVSLTTRKAVAYEWDALLGDNAPLRVNLNGQLVGVPADFYDALIRPQLKSGRSRTRIIGETVGRYGVGVPAWWIAARVAQLRPSTKGQLS